MASKLTILILVLTSMTTMSSTCRKNCTQTNYSFFIEAKAYPDIDSIYIGDTIWIELSEPSTLKDQASNNMINYSRAQNLGTAIGFRELIGNAQSREAANDFEFKVIIGKTISNPNVNLIREYLFEEIGPNYLFLLGIVPTKTGVYRISLSDAANVFRKNDPCSKASFRLNFKETNQHMYLHEIYLGTNIPLPNNLYCFKVK